MSIEYCNYCGKKIDTDKNAEHFDSKDYVCIREEEDTEEWDNNYPDRI